MNKLTLYRALFIILFALLAIGLNQWFEFKLMARYPFFFGMVPVLLGMWAGNYLYKSREKS